MHVAVRSRIRCGAYSVMGTGELSLPYSLLGQLLRMHARHLGQRQRRLLTQLLLYTNQLLAHRLDVVNQSHLLVA